MNVRKEKSTEPKFDLTLMKSTEVNLSENNRCVYYREWDQTLQISPLISLAARVKMSLRYWKTDQALNTQV